jgi:hypothetical protein
VDSTGINASVSQIDPDDDRNKDVWSPVVLRFSCNRMTMAVQPATAKGEYPVERRFLRFRGPRLLQRLLTPFFAPVGMLFSRRDVRWNHTDQQQPVVELRPCVPPDFWFAFRFENQLDAEKVSRTLEDLFR